MASAQFFGPHMQLPVGQAGVTTTWVSQLSLAECQPKGNPCFWVPRIPTWCITRVLQRALETLVLPFEVLDLGCAVLAAAAQVLELQRKGCSKGKHRLFQARFQLDGFRWLLPRADRSVQQKSLQAASQSSQDRKPWSGCSSLRAAGQNCWSVCLEHSSTAATCPSAPANLAASASCPRVPAAAYLDTSFALGCHVPLITPGAFAHGVHFGPDLTSPSSLHLLLRACCMSGLEACVVGDIPRTSYHLVHFGSTDTKTGALFVVTCTPHEALGQVCTHGQTWSTHGA